MLDSKIETVRLHFGIEALADWQSVEPASILKLDGVGPRTLDLIRVMLAGHDMTLAGDETPEFWRRNGRTAAQFKVGQSISDEDVCDVTPFTVAIDTREQFPFDFQGLASDETYVTVPGGEVKNRPLIVRWTKATLESGDYSIVGMENQIAVERKSKADLYGTLGSGRERFERELERLNSGQFAAVVIEAGWSSICSDPPPHSRLTGKVVYRSILALSQRFPRVHWYPMPTRQMAQRTAFRILQRFWIDSQKKENPRRPS